jgi:hypothetical protein
MKVVSFIEDRRVVERILRHLDLLADRWDAQTCSPRCRMALSRSPEAAELRAQLRSRRDFERLKRLRSERRQNKIYQQWKLDRKAFEKRIFNALLGHDSEQLALAFYELRQAAPGVRTRRLVFYPYRSFASYCRGRWHLDPEKVEKLINPFINPVIMQLERERPGHLEALDRQAAKE